MVEDSLLIDVYYYREASVNKKIELDGLKELHGVSTQKNIEACLHKIAFSWTVFAPIKWAVGHSVLFFSKKKRRVKNQKVDTSSPY